MSTKYGTIPTSTPPSTSATLEYFSRTKAVGRAALSTRRPWRQLLDPHSLSLPNSLSEALLRLRSNTSHFSMNYAIVILLVIFLSLIWHPVSLLVFAACMAAWLFFYFLREEPVHVFGRTVGETAVLAVLSVATIVLLLLTHATVNVLVSVVVGLAVVAVHAVLLRIEDRVYEEDRSDFDGV